MGLPGGTIYPEEFPFGLPEDLYEMLIEYAISMKQDVRLVAQLALISSHNPYLKNTPVGIMGSRLEAAIRKAGGGAMLDKAIGGFEEETFMAETEESDEEVEEEDEEEYDAESMWPPGHKYVAIRSRGRARRTADRLEKEGFETKMTKAPGRDIILVHYWPKGEASASPGLLDEVGGGDIGKGLGQGLGQGLSTGIIMLIGVGVGGAMGLLFGVQLGRMWR